MRRLLCFLVRLYPSRWRERYGEEFTALLEDLELRLTDLFDVLGAAIDMQTKNWTFAKIVVAFAVAGLLVGLAFAATSPQRYVSQAVLEQRTDSSEDVLTAFRKALNRDLDKWSTEIEVILPRGGRLLEVSFRSGDANQAHATNQAVVRKLIDAGNFGLVKEPSTPQEPIAPMYGMAIIMGIAGGLLLGATAALWHRCTSRTTPS